MRFVLIVLVVVVACKDRPPPGTPEGNRALVDAACPKVTHPYFYRVDKGGKTSYLLGTRHLSIALSKFPASVTDLVSKQRLIVFELPPDTEAGTLPDDVPRARAALGRESWQRFVELVGPELADAVAEKPVMYAASLIEGQFEDRTHVLEKELWDLAKRAQLASDGLETDAFQTDLLVRTMDVRLVRQAIATATGRDEIVDNLRKDIASYCTGADKPVFGPNSDREMKAAGYSQAEIEAYEDAMVFGRSRAWIPKLEVMFADGAVVVAVGAAHLRGERGVPALLRADGFTVTRVED